ncbi:MAG: FHA domain-containing protein [Lachnospiraceae bacterium]|nr:FHA domain-containing protein [Lachnospiraceae bacterium]
MITEHIKNLNSSYETVALPEDTGEKRYQYRMAATGRLKSILDTSIRYIDGRAYLYYDITSLQSVGHLFAKRKVNREWIRRLFKDIRSMKEELEAYLLGIDNVYFAPDEIYRNLGDNSFVFMYVPYLEEDNRFGELMDYIIEKADYEDEKLVECVYRIYESYEEYGRVYLEGQIFEDIKALECEDTGITETEREPEESAPASIEEENVYEESYFKPADHKKRKGLLSIFEKRAEKERRKREMYKQRLKLEMEGLAVAETPVYKETEEEEAENYEEEDEYYGRTVFIPETEQVRERGLFSEDDRLIAKLKDKDVTIGKSREDAEILLQDTSVSRIHARIVYEDGEYYIEDMNSTNGTFKNNLRLKPYEKRRLMPEDEIRLGNLVLIYR